jgi:glycosyltransferase involved in cell wall biosynthesis
MVGPVPGPPGGIATLVEAILASRLRQEYGLAVLDTAQKGRLRYSPDVPGLRTPAYTLWHLLKLCRLLHEEKPEIVHVQASGGLAFLRDSLFIMVARAWRKKVVCHFHGMLADQYVLFRNRVLRSYFRLIMRWVDVLILLSPRFVTDFDGIIARTQKRFVANFVPSLNPPEKKPQSRMRVLYVGRLSGKKGVFDLLKAATVLKDEPGIQFCLAGLEEKQADKDRILSELRDNGIQDRVHLAGYVQGREKAHLFESSDVLILPSYADVLPVAVIEAMAAAMPVIATPVGAVLDMVEDGVNGFIVPQGDYEMVAERILYLFRHPGKREEMGQSSLRKFNQEYSSEVNLDRIGKIYQGLLRQEMDCSRG